MKSAIKGFLLNCQNQTKNADQDYELTEQSTHEIAEDIYKLWTKYKEFKSAELAIKGQSQSSGSKDIPPGFVSIAKAKTEPKKPTRTDASTAGGTGDFGTKKRGRPLGSKNKPKTD